MIETYYSFIDKVDIAYWMIVLLLLFIAMVIVYIFFMIRSKKELEYLEYEIKESEVERKQYARMRDELRRF